MRALQIDRPRHLRIIDAPEPDLQEGQVLVRIRAISICGTDMRYYRRVAPEESYPFPPGFSCHECAGVVEESRAEGFAPGQRVIALPTIPHLYGGAEYFVTTPAQLIPLPEEGDLATWVMCQPFGTVVYTCQRLGSVVGKKVVVLGQGAIGLSFTMMLQRMGATEVIVAEPLERRRQQAQALGATLVLDPRTDDVGAAVADVTNGTGADLVVEAAGEPETINQAINLTKREGRIIAFGIPEDDQVSLDYFTLQIKEITLEPTVSNTAPDPVQPIRDAVRLCAQGRVDLSWMVTHRLPFEEAPRAYTLYDHREDGVIKVVMQA